MSDSLKPMNCTPEQLQYDLQMRLIDLETQIEHLRITQAKYEESNNHYFDLFDNAPVAYLTLSDKGLITEINLAAAELLGEDRSKLLSRRFADLVASNDDDQWNVFFSKLMQYHRRLSIKLALKGFNNTEFPVLLDCRHVNSMMHITITDFILLKQPDTALRKTDVFELACPECIQIKTVQKDSLDNLQKIASQLPGMVFQFLLRGDGSSCFPYASEAIGYIYRLSPEDVREDASKVFALLHPDDYDGIISSIFEAALDLSPWCYEYRVRFDDGTVRWLLGNALLQREIDGSTLWHGFITDITERKQMEETLRVTEKRLAFAVEYSQIGVWDLDLINNTSWRSIDHDRIFGYEVPPSKWSTVIAMRHVLPEDRQRFSQCIKKAFRTGKLLLECRIIQPNQSLRWIKARGRVIYDENAQPMRMLGTVVDITEHKNAKEKEREHLEKLAQVTRFGLMGEMASGIAHEVNQPLCAIATYAQVSINLINSENPDMAKIKEVLSKTQQQALRAGQIIHRMKEFGKSHLKQHLPTDINALIYNAADLCITELKENNVKLSFDLTNDLPLVCVDHIQIEQVIINLMRNSVDALQNVPTMHSRQLTIRSLLTPENDIQVSVKDNGLGIDEDQQQKILTPFHTTKLNGTGMGLSISHSLIQAHEGTLYFNSKLGKGSTFYFTLPIETAEREDLLQSI